MIAIEMKRMAKMLKHKVTPRNRVSPGKLIAGQVVNKLRPSVEQENSLSFSQQVIAFCSELDTSKSNRYPCTNLFNIHFNIILPSTLGSQE
jgi:hypothetical protein